MGRPHLSSIGQLVNGKYGGDTRCCANVEVCMADMADGGDLRDDLHHPCWRYSMVEVEFCSIGQSDITPACRNPGVQMSTA